MLSRGWLKVGHSEGISVSCYFSQDIPEKKLSSPYFICFSIVQIDESIVPILALDKASQAGKELNR